MSNNRAVIELSVFQGNTLIARQSFDQDKIILGRISSADFKVPSPQVSRIHALLEILQDGQMKITDLASTHGTFVNGSKIVEAILRENDQVKVADVDIRIVRVSRPVTTPPAPSKRNPTHLPIPQPIQAPSVGGMEAVSVSAPPSYEAPVVKGPREATVIRSLKESASVRGEALAKAREELEVTMYWEDTILAIDHYKRGRNTITLGDGIKTTYLVADSSIPQKYKFVEINGSRVEVNLHPAMKMSARINGHMYTNEELVKSGRTKIELGGNDIAKVKIGTIHFFLMFVPDPPALERGPILERDPVFWSLFVTVFASVFLLVTLSMVFQKPIEGEVKEFPEQFRKILIKTYQAKKEVLPPQPVTQEADKAKTGVGLEEKKNIPDAIKNQQRNQLGGNEGEGKRSPGPEGKRGVKDSPHDTGVTVAPKVKGPDSKDPGPSNKSATGKGKTHEVSKFGLLNSLKSSGLTSKLAKLSGTDGGNDDLEMKFSGFGGGGLQSAKGVSPRGGLQGTGSGGGGTEPVVGVGGLGTKGFGQGAKGSGLGGIPGNGPALISTESGGISVGAGISKEEIDRVVKAHYNELEFCYQQAKQRNGSLAGKIALSWTIISGGAVAKVRQMDNSTGDNALIECFMKRLQQWRFPSPPSGASAEVEYYPFSLK